MQSFGHVDLLSSHGFDIDEASVDVLLFAILKRLVSGGLIRTQDAKRITLGQNIDIARHALDAGKAAPVNASYKPFTNINITVL